MPGQPEESAGFRTLPRRIVMISDYAADIENLFCKNRQYPDAKLKGKKKYGTAFQLDEQIEVELVRNVVEVYAVQVFEGDTAYEEFMGAVVDQLITVHDKDATLRDGKLTSLRVKKRMETITNLQAEQRNTQQELRRERAKARAAQWTQEDIDKM
ncbi:uncharacterized protein EAF02_007896 [Botrytis sinoallii]|uniref:uncharacterized protein n=1 Tax=Botrytis sinoallii TaxID=1463999 RepID=UPI00190188E1|nr:uncharacterized protein EAF02_007896 [Botrytis sinoallii]KAF7879726.1 hypothetical protein EAF02_007896 [Botrytis sinoallii]